MDMSSSYNFINSTVAIKVGLQGEKVGHLYVRVANGDELSYEEVIRDVEVHVQGVPLSEYVCSLAATS